MHPGKNPPNPFANAPLERQGELRKNPEHLAELSSAAATRYLLIARERNVVERRSNVPVMLSATSLRALAGDTVHSIFLGEHNAAPLFVADLDDLGDEALAAGLGARTESLRTLGLSLPPASASLAAYARAMVLWDRRHRYCGRCGGFTSSQEGGHVRRCRDVACGNSMFPRVDPAIIVLVTDGERALLGRQASWDANRYSTLAGFVEPGESLEEAVAREVHEESGVRVHDVEYHSSQPWPFPSSLMLGFIARASSTEIVLRDGELESAQWISRADIVDKVIRLPFRVSISYRLIEHWYDAGNPGQMQRDLGQT